MNNDIKHDKPTGNGSVAAQLERLVMWFRGVQKRRRAKILYDKLWEANDILLSARYGFLSKNNIDFHHELEKCLDQLERTIVKVKNEITHNAQIRRP